MFGGGSMVFLWAATTLGQVPVPLQPAAPGSTSQPADDALLPEPPPPPAAEPTPAPPKPTAPPAQSARPAPPAPPPAAAPPPLDPPLEPPPGDQPARRPAFLHTREEMERIRPTRERRGQSSSEPATQASQTAPKDFLLRASPWVDFTLTSFYMEDRAGNFLNLGVQFGGYLFERLRLSARFVTPLDDVSDDHTQLGDLWNDSEHRYARVNARSMSMLYGVSVGLVITNSRSFVFGPSVELQRTDVEAYGSTLALGLPFEWTTKRNLRIGFELAIGHAFGGNLEYSCRTFTTPAQPCAARTRDRPAGTTVLFQYYMGWSLGGL